MCYLWFDFFGVDFPACLFNDIHGKRTYAFSLAMTLFAAFRTVRIGHCIDRFAAHQSFIRVTEFLILQKQTIVFHFQVTVRTAFLVSSKVRSDRHKNARDEQPDENRGNEWKSAFDDLLEIHYFTSLKTSRDKGFSRIAPGRFAAYIYLIIFDARPQSFLPMQPKAFALCRFARFALNFCDSGKQSERSKMIAFLSGKLLEKQANSVIVDVGGVGYEVSIPLSTFYELGEPGSDVELRIYTYVREDSLQLFGFKTVRERDIYLKLISVQGVGAKSGITMLSGMNADEIVAAIRTENYAKLTAIPGVGKKTAERIVVELRDKIAELTAEVPADASAAAGAGNVFDDALSALVHLGYQKNAAEKEIGRAHV